MRILNRPMFKYGGPIKEGVMHGMKNGGSINEPQQWNTVGSPVFPKDNSGRAKHLAPAAAIMAGLANLYRGYKAAKYIAPTALTMGQKIKSALLPTARFKDMGTGAFRVGAAIKQNPGSAFMAASAVPQVGVAGYKGAKEIPGGLWSGAKRYADMVIPGDQSRWWKDKEPSVPGTMIGAGPLHGAKDILPPTPEIKKKTAAERAAEDKADRKARLEKYLDTMGYDKAKKSAIGDALIDASAIVQQGTEEGGSLKHADWGKMINQAIQTTSKRLDKPEQIREAVGLMMTKADIEKDMNKDDKALARVLTERGIDVLDKQLEGETLEDSINMAFQKSGNFPTGSTLAVIARTKGLDIETVINSKTITDFLKKNPKSDAMDFMVQNVATARKEGVAIPPGNYVVKNRIIAVDSEGNLTEVL